MCDKCVRHINKATLPLGKIKFFARYCDTHKYADIPLFANRDDNLAIEGYLYLLQRAKTKKRYTRKGRRVENKKRITTD